MARPALRIDVTSKDRKKLHELLSGGVQQVRVVLRAVALSQLAHGVSAPRISTVIPLTPQAIRKVDHRYQQGGLERASTKSSGLERRKYWTIARSSASSPWSVVTSRGGPRAGLSA